MIISFGNMDCVNNYQGSETDWGVILVISVGLLGGYLHMFKFSRNRVIIVQFCLSVSVGVTGIDLTGNYIWTSKSKFSSPLTTSSWSAVSASIFALMWQLLTLIFYERICLFTCLKQGSLVISPLRNWVFA